MDEGILLVPSDYNHDLLDPGEHGALPPYAFQWEGRWATPDTVLWDGDGALTVRTEPEALVLAWNGKPCAVGMDRLMRALKGRPKKHYTMADVENACFTVKVEGVGTVVNIPVTP